MAQQSEIEWTDATWNPVTGCTKVGAGCDNCYTERHLQLLRRDVRRPREKPEDPRRLRLHSAGRSVAAERPGPDAALPPFEWPPPAHAEPGTVPPPRDGWLPTPPLR